MGEAIKLRGHHLTILLEEGKTDPENDKLFLNIYGEAHQKFAKNLRNPSQKIEIVEGQDDICKQCIYGEKCALNYAFVTAAWEKEYKKMGEMDKDSEFLSIDIDLVDEQELRKFGRSFNFELLAKRRLEKLLDKIGIVDKKYYTVKELRRRL